MSFLSELVSEWAFTMAPFVRWMGGWMEGWMGVWIDELILIDWV